jgi:hypothetical protein
MKKKGITKAGLTSVVGNAGEYLVMGELLRRGVIAGLTPRNSPGFDIIATDFKSTVNIRVKTKMKAKGWRWNASSGDWGAEVFRNKTDHDYCVLVNLTGNGPARFRIVPTGALEKKLKKNHQNWVGNPGRDGKKRSTENRLRILDEGSGFLESYALNNWHELGLKFQIGR